MIRHRQGDHHRAASLATCLVVLLLGAACGGGAKKPGEAAAGGEGSEGATSGSAPGAGAAPSEGVSASGGAPESTGAKAPEAGADASATPAGAAPAPGEPNRREVVLFFQSDDDDVLGPERRKIFLTDSIADQAKQIVSELIGGPREEGLLPTMPEDTKVLGFYLDRSGTAYLDLSEEFVARHPGGSAEEMATIFSIVDSLTYNLPEIRRVRFLVAGEERDTLKNHLDLRRAYLKNMSVVRLEGGV